MLVSDKLVLTCSFFIGHFLGWDAVARDTESMWLFKYLSFEREVIQQKGAFDTLAYMLTYIRLILALQLLVSSSCKLVFQHVLYIGMTICNYAVKLVFFG